MEGMDRLWTYEDLCSRWGVAERQARRICERIGLRPVQLGYKTPRFRPVAVMKAEEAAERGAPSRPGDFAMKGWGGKR